MTEEFAWEHAPHKGEVNRELFLPDKRLRVRSRVGVCFSHDYGEKRTYQSAIWSRGCC